MGMFAWFVWSLTVLALGAGLYYFFMKRRDLRWSQRIGSASTAVIVWTFAALIFWVASGLGASDRDPISYNGQIPPEAFGLGEAFGPTTATLYVGPLTALLLIVASLALKKWEFDTSSRSTRARGIPTLRPLMQSWRLCALISVVGSASMTAGIFAFVYAMAHQANAGTAFTTQAEFDGAMLVFQWALIAFAGLVALGVCIAWPVQHYRILRARIEYEQLCEGLGLESGTSWEAATRRGPASELHVEGLT